MPHDGQTLAALWREVQQAHAALQAAAMDATAAQEPLRRLLKAQAELDFGDEAGQPEANLHPEQRVGVLLPLRLETRFRERHGDWVLQLRIFPEPVAFDPRPRPAPNETRGAQAEQHALQAFWTRVGGDLAHAEAVQAFSVLAERVGAARAAWLVSHVPLTPGADGPVVGEVPPPAAPLAALPPRLGVWLARGGAAPVLVKTLDVRAEEVAAQSTIERLAEAGARREFNTLWWNSFEVADQLDLACEIVLGASAQIDRLIVAGLGSVAAAEVFGAHAEAGQLGVLAPGTATHSVDGAPTVALAPGADARFELLRRVGASQAGTRQLATALTGDPGALPALPGGDVDVRTTAQRAASLLLPAILGRAFIDQWQLGLHGHEALRWATRWLLPGGPSPVLRVADLPYGVLPVAAAASRWKAASDEPAVETAILVQAERAAMIGAQAARDAGTAAGADPARILALLAGTPVTSRWLAQPALPLPLVALGTAGTADAEAEFAESAREAVVHGFAPVVPVVNLGAARELPPKQVHRDALELGTLAPLAFEPWSRREDTRDRHDQDYDGSRLVEAMAVARRLGGRHLVECLIDASMVLTQARLSAVLDGGDGSVNLIDGDELLQRVQRLITPSDRRPPVIGSDLQAEVARAWEDARTAFDEVMDRQHELPAVVDAAYGLLDAASHRADQWATGVADRRLRRLAERGVPFVIGAYGWVDAPAPAGVDLTDLRPGPGPTPGGLIHAPGSPHAAAAALLRDRAVNAPGGLWNVTLDSTRIRGALRLAGYIREGITLAEALGREVEAILGTSRGRLDALRKAFPARGENAGRQVCHGEQVLDAARGGVGTALLTDVGTGIAATPEEITQIQALGDGVQAWADLLVTDAAFALVDGQGRVAAAALDAIAGLGAPPELRAVRTPRRGTAVATTLLGVLPAAEPAQGSGPHGLASPELAAELVRRFGGAAQWTWVRDDPGGPVQVSLGTLGLEPIDLLVLSERSFEALASGGRPLRSTGGAERVAAARRLAAALTGTADAPQGWPALPAARAAQLAERAAADRDVLSAAGDDPGIDLLVMAARWGTPVAVEDLAPDDAGRAAREALIAGAGAELAARLERDDAAAPASARVAGLLGSGVALPAAVGAPAALALGGAVLRSDLDATWLETVAAVRPEAAALEAWQLAPGHGGRLLGWTLGLPPWSVPVAAGAGTTVIYGPADALSAQEVAVWPLGAWSEVVPSREHTTQAAFGFNAPDSRAPQALLVVVPPDLERPLDDEDLVAAIDWVRMLAHARTATPQALHRDGVAAEVAPLPLLHAAGVLRAGPADSGPVGGMPGGFMVYERIAPDPWPEVATGVATPVADPLWLLGRQWQVGEHRGEDASSPVELSCETSTAPLASLDQQPGPPGVPSDPALVPAEALIEADPASWWTPGRRIRLGAAAAARLDALGLDEDQRRALCFPRLPPPYEAHGGAVDGRAVFLAGYFAGDALWAEVPATPPDHWRSERLDYAAAFAAQGGGHLDIDGHAGGEMDWWSCDASAPPAAATRATRSVVPGRLRYPGAPLPRHWQIEDAGLDPSAFPPDAPRWATALWTDVVASASGDWFVAPVPTAGGAIGSIFTLHRARVRDSFEDWWELAFPRVRGEPGTLPEWSIYRTTGLPAGALVLWPTAAAALSAAPWEEALLGVDEDADLCWAVETRIDGSAHEAGFSPAPPTTTAAAYRLEPSWGVPAQGHPYRMEERPGGMRFVQGLVADLSGTVPQLRPGPATTLLRNHGSAEPGHELRPVAVPSAGVRLVRRFRLARAVDGRPVLWLQTERLPLQTGPVSHLRFDPLLPETGA